MYAQLHHVIGARNRQSAVGAGPLEREKEAGAWQLVPPRPALLSSLMELPEESVCARTATSSRTRGSAN